MWRCNRGFGDTIVPTRRRPIDILNLCMATCGRRFRRAFSTKSLLVRISIFFFDLVALLVFGTHFHFGSNTSDYITMLNSSSMKAFNNQEMIY